MRKHQLLFVMCFGAVCALPQTPAGPPTPQVLQNISQDPSDQSPRNIKAGIVSVDGARLGSLVSSTGLYPVEVRLTNVSPKPIYALTVACVAQYQDGSIKLSDLTFDLLAVYINAAGASREIQNTLGLFRSGENYTAHLSVSGARDGTPPISVQAVVTMVSFEDRTSQGGAVQIRNLILGRKLRAAGYSAVLGDLTEAIAAEDPLKMMNSRRDELIAARTTAIERLAVIRDDNGGELMRTDLSSNRLQELNNILAWTGGDKDRLKRAVANYDRLVQVTTFHSTLAISEEIVR